jgi:hypothetical protein
MLVEEKKLNQKFLKKIPMRRRNSPTKLLVSGKLIFAKEKIRNKKAKIG